MLIRLCSFNNNKTKGLKNNTINAERQADFVLSSKKHFSALIKPQFIKLKKPVILSICLRSTWARGLNTETKFTKKVSKPSNIIILDGCDINIYNFDSLNKNPVIDIRDIFTVIKFKNFYQINIDKEASYWVSLFLSLRKRGRPCNSDRYLYNVSLMTAFLLSKKLKEEEEDANLLKSRKELAKQKIVEYKQQLSLNANKNLTNSLDIKKTDILELNSTELKKNEILIKENKELRQLLEKEQNALSDINSYVDFLKQLLDKKEVELNNNTLPSICYSYPKNELKVFLECANWMRSYASIRENYIMDRILLREEIKKFFKDLEIEGYQDVEGHTKTVAIRNNIIQNLPSQQWYNSIWNLPNTDEIWSIIRRVTNENLGHSLYLTYSGFVAKMKQLPSLQVQAVFDCLIEILREERPADLTNSRASLMYHILLDTVTDSSLRERNEQEYCTYISNYYSTDRKNKYWKIPPTNYYDLYNNHHNNLDNGRVF